MKIAVIGAGMMGSTVAWDLSRSSDVDEVHVADISRAKLTSLKEKTGEKVIAKRFDVTDAEQLRRFLREKDVAVSALPHGAVHPVDVAAVDCGARMVNIAFEDEQMKLHRRARGTGAVLIPGCGLAPGLSNILVSEGTRELEETEGHIYVGGLPQHPEPPLWYRLVFSVRGLVREYASARIIRDRKVVEVRPFEEIERVRFSERVGTLEAFFTDGLGSSIYSLRGIRALDERTLRYPGHAERVKFLSDAGFFSDRTIRLEDGTSVLPCEVSEGVLRDLLTKGDPRDLTVMRVVTSGLTQGNSIIRTTFDLLDYYDEENGITSMGRTTGFTASTVARMLGRGEIEGAGVLPPETTLDARAVRTLIAELSSKGISIKVTRRTSSTRVR